MTVPDDDKEFTTTMPGSLSRNLSLCFAGLLLACATVAQAQEMMQLDAPPESYQAGGFHYEPPTLDGWRQLVASPESFEIIYAEAREEGTIESKLHVVGRVFPIPQPEAVPDSGYLVQLARSQQIEKRKDILVALSAAAPVPGTADIWTYTLIVPSPLAKEGEERMLYEDFYVALAPDKSEYFVLNANTEDPDYRTQQWFAHFYGSLASVRHRSAPAKDDEDGGEGSEPASGDTAE
jgi:hypothetical protein